MAVNYHFFLGVLMLAYIGWRIYARLRRTIGEQQFRPARLKFSIAIFTLLSAAIFLPTFGHPQLMLGWIGGLVPGVLLGLWALRLTHFTTIASGRFYTPNAHIGLGLSVLFIVRLLYRMAAIYGYLSVTRHSAPAWGESALTYLTFELLAGYYIAYSAGVLAWYAREDRPPAPVA